jgi:prevent-host-death family protein
MPALYHRRPRPACTKDQAPLHIGADVRTTSRTLPPGKGEIVGVVGVRELGRHASKVVSDVRRSGRPVIVTVNGQPAAVVLPLKAEDLEDFVLSYGEQFVRDRLAADAEFAEGKTSSLDDVVAELDD